MVRAAPRGLRFWLTVDQRTNDTLSVSAVCETYCSNICCEALWLNCNRISFNRSENTTQSPPIHRRQRHFVLTVKGPVWPRWPKISPCVTTKIMWNKNSISIKSHQFVTNCPYQTMYSKHNYEFLLRFHDSFAGQLRNQIRTTCLWKIDK